MQITPENIVIRRGQPGDFQAVRELDRELIAYDRQFDPSLDPEWSQSSEAMEFFEERLAGQGVALVAEFEGHLVGCLLGAMTECASYRQTVVMAEMETLFIRGEARGTGVGKRLVGAFADWAKAEGAERITIRVSAANRDALRFYEREGFAAYDIVMERGL
ncbi:MAG: N-acetyltransferase family protein [Puniceicoccales bacterium]